MELPALASVLDLTARQVTLADEAEETVASTYLGVASAAVRAAAGSPIGQVTSTVELPATQAQYLRLPGPPVTAVGSVTVDGEAVEDWKLDGGYLWRRGGWRGCDPGTVTVTYTHGLPTVPADVVDLVCRMTASALDAYREGGVDASDVSSERIDDYSVTYRDGAPLPGMSIPAVERAALAARFGGGADLVGVR